MARTLYRRAHLVDADRTVADDLSAVLVDGDRIAWAGPDADAARTGAVDAADVRTVEVDGALLTPAFVDAHVHVTSTGLAVDGPDLTAAGSLAECLRAVEDFARRRRGGVVQGHGWDETRWPEGRPPTRDELDRASYGGVVYLSRVDVHSAVVSSALLAAAPEIRAEPGFRDDGRVSGAAHHVARRVARASMSAAQRRDAQSAALGRAGAVGIGAVHELAGPDISGAEDLAALLSLAAEVPAPTVLPYWGELGGVERARELGALGAAGDLFVDGAIGSRTAWTRQVYADAGTTGNAYLDAAAVRDHVVACTEAGLQAGFHTIGDAACAAVAAGLEAAAERVGARRLRAARHRLEHAEMLDAAMVGTFAGLGVVASVQPAFDRLWGGPAGMYAERLGADRAVPMNPFRDLHAAGVVLAFGSDSPVTPLGPWGTVLAAVAHTNPAQRLEPAAALAAHTTGGWYAAGRAGGLLRAGAPAYLAVWETGATDLGDVLDLVRAKSPPRCQLVVAAGRPVHDS